MKKSLKILAFIFVFLLSVANVSAQTLGDINIDSRFMSVIEIDQGNVTNLYQKNEEARMYPASMTKVMSVFVAVKHLDNLDENVTLTAADFAGLSAAGASMAGFSVGETVTISDLLHGSLLASGAEATRTLARLISGDEDSFVALMNEEAKQLGMNDTHFVNTSGLHDDEHYSTTSDFALLMVEVMKDPDLKEMLSKLTYRTNPSNLHSQGILLQNTLIAYSEIGGHEIGHILGGKTGWTPQAGYCLVSFSELHDKVVVIISADGFEYGIQLKDHNAIYEELFETQHEVTVLEAGQQLGEVKIRFASNLKTFPLIIEEDISVQVPQIVTKDDIEITIEHPEMMDTPLEQGTTMGSVSVTYGDEILHEKQFELDEAVARNNIYYYAHRFIEWITTPMVAITIVGIILFVILLLLTLSFVRKIRLKKSRYKTKRKYYNRKKWRL